MLRRTALGQYTRVMQTREPARRAGRRARALAAAASALLVAFAVTGYSAVVEAESRARLLAEIADVSASITRSTDTGRAVVASHLSAAICVAEASARLAPVVHGGERLTAASVERATTVVRTVPDVAPAPAYDPAPPAAPRADADSEALETALEELRRIHVETASEVAALASTARRTEQQCRTAEAATASLVADITQRTDELIAANPKAAAGLATALSDARAAVVAAEAGAVEQWLAAAAALEASQHEAVAAEQRAAAEAARAAEAEAALAAEAAAAAEAARERGPGGGTAFDPNRAASEPRALTTAEVCQLIPSFCTDGEIIPLPLG